VKRIVGITDVKLQQGPPMTRFYEGKSGASRYKHFDLGARSTDELFQTSTVIKRYLYINIHKYIYTYIHIRVYTCIPSEGKAITCVARLSLSLVLSYKYIYIHIQMILEREALMSYSKPPQ
jgi:hypothetical protein